MPSDSSSTAKQVAAVAAVGLGLGVGLLVYRARKQQASCPASGAKAAGKAKCPFQEIVKATAPAVAPKARDIVDVFYPRMFKNNPEVKAFFNPAHQFGEPPRQRMALTNAVLAYATNIDNLGALTDAVKLIAAKHCALNVLPEHYPVVHCNFMTAVGEVLGDVVTPEIGEGWSEAVLSLAKILIDAEEALYKEAESRAGGWRGVKDFAVAEVREAARGCVELTFKPADGSRAGFEFVPGQYTTVHLKQAGATPRHYTIVSKPGEPLFKICVKRIPDGVVSGGLHSLKVGDVVGLSPPFGFFAMGERPAVLVSAGIGATPMKALLESHRANVRLAVHVDKEEATHPYRQDFLSSGVPTDFHYTKAKGRATVAQIVEKVRAHIKDCDFYVCAPTDFLKELSKGLTDAGAACVVTDAFTPALA